MGADESGGLSPRFAKERSDAIGAAVEGALSESVGSDFSAKMRGVDAVDENSAVEGEGPLVHMSYCSDAEEPGPAVHFIASREEAAVIAGLQLGQDAEAIEAATKQPLSDDFCGAFQKVAAALWAPLGEALEGALPPDAVAQELKQIEEPRGEAAWLSPGAFVRLLIGIDCELIEEGMLTVLLPGDGTGLGDGPSTLIFLEHSAEEFDRIEVLGESMPCEVQVEQPHLFLSELQEELVATVIIVPWDMAGRSGLEFLEALLVDPRLGDAKIVMSSEAPTRGQVMAALQAGAISFLSRPYDPQEIHSRLFAEPAAASKQPESA